MALRMTAPTHSYLPNYALAYSGDEAGGVPRTECRAVRHRDAGGRGGTGVDGVSSCRETDEALTFLSEMIEPTSGRALCGPPLSVPDVSPPELRLLDAGSSDSEVDELEA